MWQGAQQYHLEQMACQRSLLYWICDDMTAIAGIDTHDMKSVHFHCTWNVAGGHVATFL